MAERRKQLVVFVHGWSVTNTNTYGGLPRRLSAEAAAKGLDISVREVFLGRYVSFRDEVRMEDVSRAFEAAVGRDLADAIESHGRFACITHSTGGPVVRDWLRRFHAKGRPPLSHLIMLAPANFGSALAQLGKSRLSRMKTWFQGVEPGTGILDWLELGSPEAWDLNRDWIEEGEARTRRQAVYPFVLTGQSIDRKLVDHLNTYTGEMGSDGVVRVAAADLNATYVRLEQEFPQAVPGRSERWEAPRLRRTELYRAPRTALRILAGKSHSGSKMGILRSVRAQRGDRRGQETTAVILDALNVRTRKQYESFCERHGRANELVVEEERLETVDRLLLRESHFVHDRGSMVVFRVRDEEGHALHDFDLLLTGGQEADPNHLPRGFFLDRQRNRRHPGTLTYYVNHDVMAGCPALMDKGEEVRPASPGVGQLGFRLVPRPTDGLVHYLPCELQASRAALRQIIRPNATTMVEVVLRRIVREGVFRLQRGTKTGSFKNESPGPPVG